MRVCMCCMCVHVCYNLYICLGCIYHFKRKCGTMNLKKPECSYVLYFHLLIYGVCQNVFNIMDISVNIFRISSR